MKIACFRTIVPEINGILIGFLISALGNRSGRRYWLLFHNGLASAWHRSSHRLFPQRAYGRRYRSRTGPFYCTLDQPVAGQMRRLCRLMLAVSDASLFRAYVVAGPQSSRAFTAMSSAYCGDMALAGHCLLISALDGRLDYFHRCILLDMEMSAYPVSAAFGMIENGFPG